MERSGGQRMVHAKLGHNSVVDKEVANMEVVYCSMERLYALYSLQVSWSSDCDFLQRRAAYPQISRHTAASIIFTA